MSIVSSLYLSTDSILTLPINRTNLANCSWIVDWDSIFHGKTGLCKVTVNMVSKKGAVPDTWNSTVGIMSANFSSNYAVNNNGFPLTPLTRNQYVEVTLDATSDYVAAYVYYYAASSVQNNISPVINIPTGKNLFTIMMSDTSGNYIPNFPEYNVFLYFEWMD